jgi:hypothetical protein
MKDKIKIPTKLSECFSKLNEILKDSPDGKWFLEADEDEAVANSYHGLGSWIRNNWGLWEENSPLYTYFNKLGLIKPHDMSSVILLSYHRHLNNKEIKLDRQIKDYIEFWKNKI